MTFVETSNEYYIPMDVIVALMFDKRLGTARFQNVKHKASSNTFLNRLSFHASTLRTSALAKERLQNYDFFSNLTSF